MEIFGLAFIAFGIGAAFALLYLAFKAIVVLLALLSLALVSMVDAAKHHVEARERRKTNPD